MLEIDAEGLYTIDDLLKKWKTGWQALRRLAQSVYGGELLGSACDAISPLDRLLIIIEDALNPLEHNIGSYLQLPETLPDRFEILNLAASSGKAKYAPVKCKHKQRAVRPTYSYDVLGGLLLLGSSHATDATYGGNRGDWAKNKRASTRVLKRIAHAFESSDTFGEAFEKLASLQNRKLYYDFWQTIGKETPEKKLTGYERRNVQAAKSEWLACPIGAPLRAIMKLVAEGVNKTVPVEEVWWKCLRVLIKERIDDMLDAQQRIHAGTPIWKHQMETLRKYVSLGRLRLDFVQFEDNGLHRMRMHVAYALHCEEWRSPFIQMMEFLLVEPAVAMSQELHRYFQTATYIRRCHAPSCGKSFFTRRKSQILCESVPGGRSSECRREWTNYSRWLKNLGKDPKTDWNHSHFKEQWLKSRQ